MVDAALGYSRIDRPVRVIEQSTGEAATDDAPRGAAHVEAIDQLATIGSIRFGAPAAGSAATDDDLSDDESNEATLRNDRITPALRSVWDDQD